jgi:hypothetical protein
MPARRRTIRRLTAALMAVALSFAAGAMVGTAQAKSLGNLTSNKVLGKFDPTDAITDNFDDGDNIPLAGTKDAMLRSWVVGPGGFKAINSGIGQREQATTATSEATVLGTVNASVGGDIHAPGTASFGLVLNAAVPTSYAATLLLYDGAHLNLQRVSPAGVRTPLRIAYNFTSSNFYLRLSYLNGVYTVYVNGVTQFSVTVTGAVRTEIEGYSQVGFATISDTTTTFDNFQAYAL